MVGFSRRKAGQRWEPSEKVHICQQVQTLCKLPFSYLQNQTTVVPVLPAEGRRYYTSSPVLCGCVLANSTEPCLVPSLVQLGWEGSKDQDSQENKAGCSKGKGIGVAEIMVVILKTFFNSHIAICTL